MSTAPSFHPPYTFLLVRTYTIATSLFDAVWSLVPEKLYALLHKYFSFYRKNVVTTQEIDGDRLFFAVGPLAIFKSILQSILSLFHARWPSIIFLFKLTI